MIFCAEIQTLNLKKKMELFIKPKSLLDDQIHHIRDLKHRKSQKQSNITTNFSDQIQPNVRKLILRNCDQFVEFDSDQGALFRFRDFGPFSHFVHGTWFGTIDPFFSFVHHRWVSFGANLESVVSQERWYTSILVHHILKCK